MILVKHQYLLRDLLSKDRRNGLSVGFVPTMGALHGGHLALTEIAASQAAVTVCSIFVNPTQFNDPQDFDKYPVTTETDIRLLESAPIDFLLLPGVQDIYPGGTASLEQYDLGILETILEGKFRPGHYQGVCQVMKRLLDMVQPDLLFMGQKDYQQCMVVEKLIQLLELPVTLVRCPTLREADGLAMSSRNRRLTPEQRERAPAIFQSLENMKADFNSSPPGELKKQAAGFLNDKGFRVDYVEIADANTLEPLEKRVSGRPGIALIAAFLGEVRLIDNMLLG